MKRIMRGKGTAALFLGLLLCAGRGVNAVPEITAAEGDPVHGSSCTLSGSGFGTPAGGFLLKFDDFEDGTAGDPVGNGWALHYYGPEEGGEPVPPAYTDGRSHGRGTTGAVCNFDHQYRSDFGMDRVEGVEYQELYVSFLAYVELDGELSRNFKIFRAYGASPEDTPQFVLATFPDGGDSWLFDVPGDTLYGGSMSEDSWHRYEVWARYATVDTQDSAAKLFEDAQLVIDRNDLDRGSNPYGLDEIRIGHYYAHDKKICTDPAGPHYLEDCGVCSDGSWESSCHSDFCEGTCEFTSLACAERGGCRASIFFDDVYVSPTQARVEIGDRDHFVDCTRRAIQIPLSWDDGSVEVRLNQDTFAGGEPLYLYVIDPEGTPSDPGFPFTFSGGDGEDGEAVAEPPADPDGHEPADDPGPEPQPDGQADISGDGPAEEGDGGCGCSLVTR